MIGRRAVIGLSLLCALLFSVAAESASAATATNTTAVTCVPVLPNTGKFGDAHCDANVVGNFEHQPLPTNPGETTKVTVTNEKTVNATTEASSMTLTGEPFGVKTEITCKTAKGTGKLGNTAPSGGVHEVSGEADIDLSNCEVKKVTNCTKVKEPIVIKASTQGVEGLGAGKNEMGVEYKAPAGKPFASITLEGTCAIAGKAFNLEGSMVATGGTATQTGKHAGATEVFTSAMSTETVTMGGKKACFTGLLTTLMESGNPIALTTVT